MSAKQGPHDRGYSLQAKLVQQLIIALRNNGHEIGFHPGYSTFMELPLFMAEKYRLDKAIDAEKYGGRQHFLRFQVPTTWRVWEQAGLEYDSTLGYAEQEGFRCGTCHPYFPFDIEQDRQLDVLEIPLIVMEVTLKNYRKLTPAQGQSAILELAQKCKNVNGVFTLLWHNISLHHEWEPWIQMYQDVLPQLAEMEGRRLASELSMTDTGLMQ